MIRGVAGMRAYQAMAAPAPAPSVPSTEQAEGASFGDTMKAGLEGVEDAQQSGESALELLATGEVVDLHGTMIELEKADIALRTMVSVRDKVIAAYEQVMNMGV